MSFPVVQWLRHRVSIGEGTGSSLVGEVRSHMLPSMAPTKKLCNTVGVASFHMLRDTGGDHNCG